MSASDSPPVPSDTAATAPSSAALPAPPPPALLPALALFERGDFRGTRTELDRLTAAQGSSSPEIAAAATSLRSRIDIDPYGFAVGLFALGILVLCSVAYL